MTDPGGFFRYSKFPIEIGDSKQKRQGNLLEGSLAAPSHNFRHELAIDVLTPSIA
jgi:hypothetical protein